MTIEELTFTAFLAGRERGREESAAQIERLTNAAKNFMSANHEYQTFRPDENCEDWEDDRMRLYETLNLAEAELSAALQPKEDDQ